MTSPLRLAGTVYVDGHPEPITLHVPPGPLADAITAGILTGLAVDLPRRITQHHPGDRPPLGGGNSSPNPQDWTT